MKKYSFRQMRFIKARIAMTKSTEDRTEYIRKKQLFAAMGKDVFFCPRIIPEEPYMIKLHSNIVIAINVKFITHDIFNDMLAKKFDVESGKLFSEYHMGTIEIFDNVAIGSDSIILYNTKIGPNAIVAAGSVVTKDVPEGAIVGGNPARIIGRMDDFIEKRKAQKNNPINRDSLGKIISHYWPEI